MKRYLVLAEILEDDAGKVVKYSLGEYRNSRTCATCRWAAEPFEKSPNHLICLLADEEGSKMGCGIVTLDDLSLAKGAADLIVAPDFGCVQWEGE